MEQKQTALLLVGYQNDWFSPNGVLYGVFEKPSQVDSLLKNTVELIKGLDNSEVLIVSTPIVFSQNYRELVEPTGILKTVKEANAFLRGSDGVKPISELVAFGNRITSVPGKIGMNAFAHTELHEILQNHGITNLCLAGVVSSLCIDSTARWAYENGYKVTVLSDCTSGRTVFEQEFYCEKIFPLYADVMDHETLLKSLGLYELEEVTEH